MDRDCISEIVIKTMAKLFSKDEDDLHEGTALEMLEIDSIKFIEMVVALEDAFSIEYEDEYLIVDKFKTIGSVVKYIVGRLEAAVLEDI